MRRSETPQRSRAVGPLPDYIRPGLKLLFVGINPGLISAAAGRYYANPRNEFWRLLYEARLTPVPLGPDADASIIRFGFGLTDMVKRPSRGAADLKPREFAAGRERLSRLVERFRPRAVCFNGKTAFEGFFGQGSCRSFGPQPVALAKRPVFVLPSTSPANAGIALSVKRRYFRALGSWIGRIIASDGQSGDGRTLSGAERRQGKTRIAIAEARPKHLSTILSLYAQLDDDRSDVPALSKARELFRRIRGYPDYKIYVAAVRGEIAGTFALAILDNLAHRGRPWGVVESVVVDRRWRGKGIGEAMMRFAMERCRARGCYKLALSSNMKRRRAHRFYRALGFRQHGYSFHVGL